MLHENNGKKEELKARAHALKCLGKIFQVPVLLRFFVGFAAILVQSSAYTVFICCIDVLFPGKQKDNNKLCKSTLEMNLAQLKLN